MTPIFFNTRSPTLKEHGLTRLLNYCFTFRLLLAVWPPLPFSLPEDLVILLVFCCWSLVEVLHTKRWHSDFYGNYHLSLVSEGKGRLSSRGPDGSSVRP